MFRSKVKNNVMADDHARVRDFVFKSEHNITNVRIIAGKLSKGLRRTG